LSIPLIIADNPEKRNLFFNFPIFLFDVLKKCPENICLAEYFISRKEYIMLKEIFALRLHVTLDHPLHSRRKDAIP